MSDSRTVNAKRNIISEVANTLVANLLPFVTRTVMIYVMGKMYLGLNSLFVSILQVLSLAELGFGSAVSYSMYKPLAENDTAAVNALLNFYRRVYRAIGLFILLAGLAVMPFLRSFIHGEVPAGVNIYLLYLINLAETVFSYFLFAYKQSLLRANQRSDIISRIGIWLNTIAGVLRVLVLLLFRNYYLYCLISPAIAVARNLMADRIARRKYPQYHCEGEIPQEQLTAIRKNVAGVFTYKLCGVFRNSFDSIVLSAYLGLGVLASYNNYYYILNTIILLLNTVSNSITAGVGNKLVTATRRENHADMMKFQLLYIWGSAWCTVCLFCLYQPFMELWVGRDMMFSDGIMTIFCVYFFTRGMNLINYIYRQAAGLWWEDRYRPIVEAFSNLLLNIILVRYIGMMGVMLSTIFTLIPFNTVWGCHLLYSRYFTEEKYTAYLLRLCYYAFTTFVGCAVTGFVCAQLPAANLWLVLILRGMLCVVLPNLIFAVMLRVLPEYGPAMAFAGRLLPKRFRRAR